MRVFLQVTIIIVHPKIHPTYLCLVIGHEIEHALSWRRPRLLLRGCSSTKRKRLIRLQRRQKIQRTPQRTATKRYQTVHYHQPPLNCYVEQLHENPTKLSRTKSLNHQISPTFAIIDRVFVYFTCCCCCCVSAAFTFAWPPKLKFGVMPALKLNAGLLSCCT